MSPESLETLDWNEVTTIILVDHKGLTYRISKTQLLGYLKSDIEEALRELWESLMEEG